MKAKVKSIKGDGKFKDLSNKIFLSVKFLKRRLIFAFLTKWFEYFVGEVLYFLRNEWVF